MRLMKDGRNLGFVDYIILSCAQSNWFWPGFRHFIADDDAQKQWIALGYNRDEEIMLACSHICVDTR